MNVLRLFLLDPSTQQESEIDLDPNQVTGLSFQITNVGEEAIVRGHNSNVLTAPRTKNNQRFFGSSEDPTSETDKPYINMVPKITSIGGEELLYGGFINLQESGDVYKLLIVGGNGNFFNKLNKIDKFLNVQNSLAGKEKQLSDLTALRSLDFRWDKWQIVNSYGNTQTAGLVYPLINWGNADNLSSEIYCDQMLPFLFVKDIISAIFTDLGYVLDASYFDGDFDYENLIISLNPCIAQRFLLGTAYQDTAIDVVFAFLNSKAPVNNNSLDPYSWFDYASNTYYYTTFFEGFYSFEAKGRISQSFIGGYAIFAIQRASAPSVIEYITSQSSAQDYIDINGDFSINVSFIQLFKGDIVNVWLFAPYTGVYNLKTFSFSCTQVSGCVEFEGNGTNTQSYWLQMVGVPESLPSLSQKQFLKDIFSLFGAFWTTNEATKTVKLFSIKEIYQNKTFAVDWSNKLDSSIKPIITTKIGSFAQINNFLWTNESTLKSSQFGWSRIVIDDDSLSPVYDFVTMNFSASVNSQYLKMQYPISEILLIADNLVLSQRNSIASGSDTLTMNTSGGLKPNSLDGGGGYVNWAIVVAGTNAGQVRPVIGNDTDAIAVGYPFPSACDATTVFEIRSSLTKISAPSNHRLLFLDYFNAPTDIDIYVHETVGFNREATSYHNNLPIAWFYRPDKTNNLDFPSLIAKYYAEYSEMLDHAKVFTAQFWLTERDISQLDMTKPIYLEQYGLYFFINTIKEWSADRLTTVELIRL